eukprot:GEMP01008415.1.p1 GENE.GEMP01008415.1~~GEMP01008415.1.p1  ORF type:complete len:643 (+),score=90.31 GEMP01008415.1:60-1988(+)
MFFLILILPLRPSAWIFKPRNETTVPRNYTLPKVKVPAEFNWKDQMRLSTDRSYSGGPYVCHAAHVFAMTTMVSDRLAIIRNSSFPEIILSSQLMLTCDIANYGCSGGALLHTLQYIHDNGVPDETCTPYLGRGRDTGEVCLRSTTCSTCGSDGSCQIIPERHMYRYVIYGFGVIKGEAAMLQEIYQKGPIACEILQTTTRRSQDTAVNRTHAVTVAGWSKTGWHVRNNWGTHWQNDGWDIVGPRGENPMRIEEYCVWADPRLPQFPQLVGTIPTMEPPRPMRNAHELFSLVPKEPEIYENPLIKDEPDLKPTPRNNLTFECTRNLNRCTPEECKCGPLYKRNSITVRDHKNATSLCYSCLPNVPGVPHSVPDSELPLDHDWRNVNNVSYVSAIRNQHLPTYCGSCWALSGTSALADRFQIKLKNKEPILLSPQAIIDCRRGGNCDGGSALHMYASIYESGIPHDTCRAYRAKNGNPEWEDMCPDYTICSKCEGAHMDDCRPVFNYNLFFVSDFGKVKGARAMKAEILRGPIVCGVMATEKMESYTGGLFSERRTHVTINHDVSLLGWGRMDTTFANNVKVEYWVMRNSWGSFWGEFGHMRLMMYRNNVGIENSCAWAVPGEIRKAESVNHEPSSEITERLL